MTTPQDDTLQSNLDARFSDAPTVDADAAAHPTLTQMGGRGSCRAFLPDPVPENLVEVLCAISLASPTKSDLQQRDVISVQSAQSRADLAELVAGQAWVASAPLILVFCGNNRRQRLLHDWRDVPFANDHIDAMFNAATDAAIAMGAFVTAAEAMGLGCCPISAVRNKAREVSDLLKLPPHVFPFAGLAVGYPAQPATVSKRLPLGLTFHRDTYSENDLKTSIARYDADRQDHQPYPTQRFKDHFGTSEHYGWSEDKVRQYSQPERANFADYLRSQGFKLD